MRTDKKSGHEPAATGTPKVHPRGVEADSTPRDVETNRALNQGPWLKGSLPDHPEQRLAIRPGRIPRVHPLLVEADSDRSGSDRKRPSANSGEAPFRIVPA